MGIVLYNCKKVNLGISAPPEGLMDHCAPPRQFMLIFAHVLQFLIHNGPLELLHVGQKLFEEPNFDRVQNLEAFRPESNAAGTNYGLRASMNNSI